MILRSGKWGDGEGIKLNWKKVDKLVFIIIIIEI